MNIIIVVMKWQEKRSQDYKKRKRHAHVLRMPFKICLKNKTYLETFIRTKEIYSIAFQ